MAHSIAESKEKEQKENVQDLVEGGFSFLEKRILACQKCALCETAANKVISKGSQTPVVVFIGEAPGKNEDETGIPFCGKAGKLLDKYISYMELKPTDWAVINTLKCRPPNNRTPTKKEIEICRPFLTAQLLLLNPKVIILLGNTAEKAFGETLDWGEVKKTEIKAEIKTETGAGVLRTPDVLKIYHPAAMIYQRSREAEQYAFLDRWKCLWAK